MGFTLILTGKQLPLYIIGYRHPYQSVLYGFRSLTAVVMLYLRNNGDQKITTNPSGWNLIADGLKYGYNSVTFDS